MWIETSLRSLKLRYSVQTFTVEKIRFSMRNGIYLERSRSAHDGFSQLKPKCGDIISWLIHPMNQALYILLIGYFVNRRIAQIHFFKMRAFDMEKNANFQIGFYTSVTKIGCKSSISFECLHFNEFRISGNLISS